MRDIARRDNAVAKQADEVKLEIASVIGIQHIDRIRLSNTSYRSTTTGWGDFEILFFLHPQRHNAGKSESNLQEGN
jgi:hypothetical protein